jgi:hypothetical protein
MQISEPRARAVRHGLSAAGFIVLFWFFAVLGPRHGGFGFDAYAYWDVQFPDLYQRSFGQLVDPGAFRYSPVIGLLMAPFHAVPFWVFVYGWTIAQVVALVLVARRWSLAACAWAGVPASIYEGNVDLFIALSVVLGMRYPAAWAFALLTKATSGVGLLWFAVRREWRPLGIALGATALIAAPTVIAWPGAWSTWFAVLADNASRGPGELIPLAVRLPAAALLTIYAARTDRLWLVGIAVMLAQPHLALRATAVAVAAIGLWRQAPGPLPSAHAGATLASDVRGG